MRVIAFLISFLLLSLPLAYGQEDVKESKDKREKRYIKQDIKKFGKTTKPDIPSEYNALVKEYNQYWKAVKEKNYNIAYSLESEGYRKRISLEMYKAKRMPVPGKHEIKILYTRAMRVKKLNEKEVIVEGSISYKAFFGTTVRTVNDRWIKEGGLWRHQPSG